ncbi:accessory gene regulator B family protein [Paenibacillaceae bacterium WGS1546]|uniref:accessory gene regulator B family protein n=1 Tax=Cohnella sp. WGS1546 TaxID=3366810 RepID=UPI00372D72C0
MIESTAERLSTLIDRYSQDRKVSLPVLKFALVGLLTHGITILFCLLIGIMVDRFAETLTALAAIAVMRMLVGGYHIPNPEWCVIVSTAIIVIVPFIPFTTPLIYISSVLSLMLIVYFAPADLRGKTRITEGSLRAMKVAAIIAVIGNMLIRSEVVAVSFLIAALTLVSIEKVVKK